VLWRYGPKTELTRLDKGVYDEIERLMANQLRIYFDMYTREAETATDPASARKYRSLAMMASFRSQVREGDAQLAASTSTTTSKPRMLSASQFHMEDSHVVESRGMSTMALFDDTPRPGGERNVVLIEWVQMPQLPAVRREAEKLALLLSAPKPDKMLVPGCLGLLDDGDRLGVVMATPPNIGTQIPTQLYRGSISHRRMPVSLKSLITNMQAYCGSLSLGIRFNIAQRLADTVHMMHTAKWVHK